MTATTTDTRAQFLAAIRASPEDDTARGAFADWLDDQGDPYSVAWAEFIRVGVELARNPGRDCGYRPGRRQPAWCSDPSCGACAKYVSHTTLEPVIRRGFAGTLSAGESRAGGFDWEVPVTWDRGFPARIEAPLNALWLPAPEDRPTEWAVAAQREWGGMVQEMVVTDRQAWQIDPKRWVIYGNGTPERPYIGNALFRLAYPKGNESDPTPELAVSRLARAVAQEASREAGYNDPVSVKPI